jgi:hypothetical protein
LLEQLRKVRLIFFLSDYGDCSGCDRAFSKLRQDLGSSLRRSSRTNEPIRVLFGEKKLVDAKIKGGRIPSRGESTASVQFGDEGD